jgi:hypothetical protein
MRQVQLPRLRRAVLAMLAGATLACAPPPLAAQQRPAPTPAPTPAPPSAPAPARDTIPRTGRDTVLVPIPPEAQGRDSLPDKATHDSVPADSLRPAPNFPAWPEPPSGSWQGTWTLTQADLQHYHGLSIVELLERVPGVLAIRTGSLGQPLALSAFALGGGRTRVFLDGYELLPISTGVFDLQQVQSVDLQAVRVERALAGMRIDITTFRQSDRRPVAIVEAADGDFATRVLRGFFTRAVGTRDEIQGTFDLASTGGYARQGPFNVTTFGARWSHLFGADRGIQLEYRRQNLDRDQPENARSSVVLPFEESSDRSDLILRGRTRLGSRLWLDAFAGRTRREPASGDSATLGGSASQFGGRAALVSSFGTLNGEARVVRGDGSTYSPSATDLSVRLDLTPLSWLAATGQARSFTLGGEVGVETEASARIGPAAGFTAFATLSAGKRPVLFARDSVLTRRTFAGLGTEAGGTVSDTSLVFGARTGSLTGLRLGGEWTRGSLVAGAAALRVDPAQVAGFGLGFDAAGEPAPGAASNGVEAYASIPLYPNGIRLDGWYVKLQDTGGRAYLPRDFGAGSLQYHRVFFTGNLEPTARLEAVVRGPGLVADSTGAFTTTPRYAIVNFFLQVRIIDVQVFVRAANLLNRRDAVDVTGYPLPGAIALYGFRWYFRN